MSSDSGGSWQRRELPAPAIDLAIAPDDPQRLVAVTQGGLYGSGDAGGKVMTSSDGGKTFKRAGDIGAPPEAFGSGDGTVLAAVAGGRVFSSSDDGKSWSAAVTPE